MAKAEWGTKRTCHQCGARFYDLRREPIICPRCATLHDPDRQPRTRKGGSGVRLAAVASDRVREPVLEDVAGDEVSDADEVEVGLDDEDEVESGDDAADLESEDQDLIEDTSDLGEDHDDIGEVIEHIDEEIEDRG